MIAIKLYKQFHSGHLWSKNDFILTNYDITLELILIQLNLIRKEIYGTGHLNDYVYRSMDKISDKTKNIVKEKGPYKLLRLKSTHSNKI